MSEVSIAASTSAQTHWLEYVSALGPLVIATFIAYVAYQQWVVNRNTLREKLFERRLEVFDGAHNFISAILRDGACDNETLSQFTAITHRARFLFGKDTQSRLTSMRSNAIRMQYLRNVWDNPENSDERSKMIEENYEILKKFSNEITAIWKHFDPYLGFGKTKY